MYLDSAATAKYTNTDDIIVQTITQAMKDSWMNPSSLYATNVKDKIDKCRKNIADFIGAKPEEIIFTSGSSESNNMAIQGWFSQVTSDISKQGVDALLHLPQIITTPIEHKSILMLLDNLYASQKHFCKVDKYGRVDLESLEYMLNTYSDSPVLVSIIYANNEIGTIQDIEAISDLVHRYNGILHIDSTQAFGHIPINVEELGVDMMSVSGHKISPVLRGIGFLYKRNGVNIKPLIYGTQENGMRGSTENTYGIIGLSKALEYCDVSEEKVLETSTKSEYLIERITLGLKPEFKCKLNGPSYNRLPNNANIILPEGVSGESVLYMLSMSNIFVSTSSACNSHSIEKSHVLKAISLTDDEAMRSIRITIPDDITYEEIDEFVDELEKAIKIIEG